MNDRIKEIEDILKAYREANKDKMKAYYKSNKDKLAKQHKAYYEANKDKICKKHRDYNKNITLIRKNREEMLRKLPIDDLLIKVGYFKK